MYKILEPIMVRMPLYSHEEYKKIDLFADVDKFIQIFSNRPSFLKAIAISSPDFYTSVIENEKNVVYSDKYRDSMLKYISRATSRATPFGAFSLVSFGKLDRETSFVIHEEKRSTFLNLIDADLFWKIIRELEQNAQIYPYLKVRLNPNLHITTNRVKNPYISHLGQSNTKFFQANIRNTKQFEMIQKYARNPISVKDLVYSLYVYNNKKIEIAKIQKYVDSLIENEFLLSELRFFDVHEGLSKIISVCKKSCFDCEMIENLKRINKVFCRLNAQCDDKEWLNAYFNLYKLCNEQFSGKNITNTLLFAPQYEATLGKNVLASLYRLENFATKTALPDNETTAVLYWKKLFKEKYGPYVEINFLELFDDNSGFGDPYAPKNHNIIELGVLNLAEKKIEYCSGCGCCFSHGFCPLDEIDDMKFIKEVFLKADIITIVVPVYAYNVPGIMKSLMDRLASWNHILNLTGKKIMVFTLTHISGAQYVCNYVSNIFSFMGGQIIHYEMLEIVKEMEKIPDLEKLIDIKAIEFVNHADLTQFINKEIVYNHFNALKNSVIRAINLGNLSFETEFWESSGLLNCDSFSEWKEKQLENDISSIK